MILSIYIIAGLLFVIWQLCLDIEKQKKKYHDFVKEIQLEEIRKVNQAIKRRKKDEITRS